MLRDHDCIPLTGSSSACRQQYIEEATTGSRRIKWHTQRSARTFQVTHHYTQQKTWPETHKSTQSSFCHHRDYHSQGANETPYVYWRAVFICQQRCGATWSSVTEGTSEAFHRTVDIKIVRTKSDSTMQLDLIRIVKLEPFAPKNEIGP
jgi:hypothetical protein